LREVGGDDVGAGFCEPGSFFGVQAVAADFVRSNANSDTVAIAALAEFDGAVTEDG
jgi:hypothetical protein